LALVDRRNSSSRPGSIDETSRVPVIDYAGTGVYRQARQARTPPPVRTPAPRAGVTETRPVPTRAPEPVKPAPAARVEARVEARPAARVEARLATGTGALAHPRLVPRPRTTPPPEPLPRLTLRPACRDRDCDFEEEPTDEMTAARSHDATRPRDVTAARSRRYR
jgi:hypothetical protein